jgi:hypothetical protein
MGEHMELGLQQYENTVLDITCLDVAGSFALSSFFSSAQLEIREKIILKLTNVH